MEVLSVVNRSRGPERSGTYPLDLLPAQELRTFRRGLRKTVALEVLGALQVRSTFQTAMAFAFDWISILISLWFALNHPLWGGLVALLVIGSRQRALSNLVHEGSHWNLLSNKDANDWVSDFFGALPLFKTTRHYRRNHLKHHAFLGRSHLDPDVDAHLEYGFDDFDWSNNSLSRFFKTMLHFRSLKESLIGNLFRVSGRERLKIALWWGIFLGVLCGAVGHQGCALFLLLWFLSKLTFYNFIRNLVEFLDHSGLPPGPIMNYTRTLCGLGPIHFVTHAHSNHFHLTHHLAPSVPWFRLKDLHAVFLGADLGYRNAHHCSGFFIGRHSALSCWRGACD